MDHDLRFDRPLLEKYDRPGPRYTSYPTAPQFHAGYTPSEYRRVAQASNALARPKPLSVYVHVPFCRSLCYYCACNKIITHKTERAAEYLEYLKREIALQAPLFDQSRKLEQLHLGGGTPTYFTSGQLAELFAELERHFQLDYSENREFSLEVDPRTVTPTQIATLAEIGFNRLSFGVQDFDPEVQKAVNRIQTEQQTRELIDAARQANFRSVSVDLIYGLPKQTVASFDATLDKVIALRPDRLAVYNYAHLPELFRAQRLIRPEDMPPPERKLELLELTIARLTAAGYVYIGMDHFALPDDELTLAQQNGTLQRNFQGYSTHADCDLIGLGVTSIGKVGASYSQNRKELPAYYQALEAGELPVCRGYELNADDELRRDVINQLMCHDRIDFASIERQHGIDFAAYFAAELASLGTLEADGLIDVQPNAIELKPTGRLLMRNVAMVFDHYLKQPQQPKRFSRAI
ncbi:oxygen-independent coproporphyrinogen III oxidase [Halomonas sp. WWR20]